MRKVFFLSFILIAAWMWYGSRSSRQAVSLSSSSAPHSTNSNKFASLAKSAGGAAQAAPKSRTSAAPARLDLSQAALEREAASWGDWMLGFFPNEPQLRRAWLECVANAVSPKCPKVMEIMTIELNRRRNAGQMSARDLDIFAKFTLFECRRGYSCTVENDLVRDSAIRGPVTDELAAICRSRDYRVCGQTAQLIDDPATKNSYLKYGCENGDNQTCDSYILTTSDSDAKSQSLFERNCKAGGSAGCERALANIASQSETAPDAVAGTVKGVLDQCLRSHNSSACQALNSSQFMSSLNPEVQKQILNKSCNALDLNACMSLWQGSGITQSAQVANRSQLCAKYYKNRPTTTSPDEVMCSNGFCYTPEAAQFFQELCI